MLQPRLRHDAKHLLQCRHATRARGDSVFVANGVTHVSVYLLAMLIGYLLTVVIETAVLLALLSRRHSISVRLFAGAWLTACTYPIVWLVLPSLFEERWLYLVVAETFAPVAECTLFWFAFVRHLPREQRATIRDFTAIVVANLCSFGIGELIYSVDGFAWLSS